jgi:hypothetical protein
MKKITKRIALPMAMLAIVATSQSALVGHWAFDETNGVIAVDASGGGYDGTVINPVWADGVIGGALEMNGTDCYVSGFGDVLSSVSNEITLSFWCAGDLADPQNMNGFSGYINGVRKLNAHLPNGDYVYFDANSSTNRERISTYIGSADESLLRGPWNHWAFTKNATTGYMAVYVNGALLFDSTDSGSFFDPMAGITDFFVGSDGESSAFYKGLMDDFRVYDNELSALEITNLYAAVTPDYTIAYATVSPESGSIPYDAVFDGSISLSSTNIIDYAWAFGDGNVGNGAVVTNTFSAIGFYTNTLTVTDENGNVDSVQLVVEAKPIPSIELAYTVESTAFEALPALSSNDLAQVYYLSSSGTVGSDSKTTTDEHHARLFDGSIVSDPLVSDDLNDCVGWDEESTVTVNFDLSVNTLGYDITNIVSIAGWSTSSGGRANQGYEVEVTYVDDSTAILAEATHWAPNNPAYFWTRVSLSETNGNVMASGVKSVTFNFSEEARPGGRVYGREIDVLGSPTVPSAADVPILVYDGSSLSWNANWPFVYSIQRNLTLTDANGWSTLTNVVGTPPTTMIDLPSSNQNTVFYRIIVE